jgi:hypothetical protein
MGTESKVSDFPSAKRQQTGVADYFAILGVGETLIWKHTEKGLYQQETDPPEEEEEDEASLEERFYREIVEISIFAVDANGSAQPQHQQPQSSAYPSQASSAVLGGPPAIPAVASYQSETSHDELSYSSHSASLNKGGDHVVSVVGENDDFEHDHGPLTLPTSPSHSEATTNTTMPTATANINNTANTPAVRNSTGWTRIEKTLPARHPGSIWVSVDHQTNPSSMMADAPPLWNKFNVWDANLHVTSGLRGEILHGAAALSAQIVHSGSGPIPNIKPLKGLRRKMEYTIRQFQHRYIKPDHGDGGEGDGTTKFYLAYRRRQQLSRRWHTGHATEENEKQHGPAIADVSLHHVRVHRSILPYRAATGSSNPSAANEAQNTSSSSGIPMAALAGQILERYQSSQAKHDGHGHAVGGHKENGDNNNDDENDSNMVPMTDYLTLPDGFDEWSIPHEYRLVRDPSVPLGSPGGMNGGDNRHHRPKTVLFEHDDATYASGEIGVGVEAVETISDFSSSVMMDPSEAFPRLVSLSALPDIDDEDHNSFVYIPVLAVRRQRMSDEERYHEDPGIVDLSITFSDRYGEPVLPDDTYTGDDDEEEDDEGTFRLLGKTQWARSASASRDKLAAQTPKHIQQQFGLPLILVRRNIPFGFADATFATRVRDRFPTKNYKGLPLPEEELPMFCYPTGCRLYRAQFSDAPLAQYYGFVVKNERGDSIYVSCVSFMEPLTSEKVNQLAKMSEKRRRYSLPHRIFCERRDRQKAKGGDKNFYRSRSGSEGSDSSTEADSNFLLTGFDQMTTFENKTICLVGRYPFWTGFRKFLSHLHILSGSSSEIPLERCISHLLLSVPVPVPGGSSVLIPLPALNEPMVLSLPPEKDFPLVDLPYHRLVACLDIATIVMIVLGLLTLERKIIIMSSRPSLVLDVCELLRSLLFPFDLCAPYVPRLTEPFKTSLEFPGAIFVGIHDDGTPNGLAASVRKDLPEDSIIVDLDTGEVECTGDRNMFISNTWDIIPESARTVLVSELETLCRDAGIVPGQEPLDSQLDSAFDVTLPSAVSDYDLAGSDREPLDDRAVRDSFLRFFCGVLGGYERYLVVPDADFLVSGNEWFDSKGFLASVSSEKAPYLNNLVGTQLFQAFIQKRTEASDVHCLLFDECLGEFHSSPMPYGRLGEDVEAVPFADSDQPQMLYSLLVDQAAVLPSTQDHSAITVNRSMDASEAGSSVVSIKYSESALNITGDIVTAPSRQDLKVGVKYIYCIDGNPCFPHCLKPSFFLPSEPESWLVEMSKTSDPLLARSERELEEANRKRRMATSHRGFQNQRRCLWQLPKLMGSHFLGSWLLCIPAQMSQTHISHEQQSRYLLRALGALRLMRSKQRIVPDEAAYRALMVACGRARSDRRVELVKLFGLLRSDGIFPSAVTLGQYTKAVAEGYSKRSSGLVQEDDIGGVEVTESGSKIGRFSIVGSSMKGSMDFDACLSTMDGNLSILETQGRRWRHRSGAERAATGQPGENAGNSEAEQRRKRSQQKSWLPVVFSSSFAPTSPEQFIANSLAGVRLTALWSRTRACGSCGYIPLEEEVQAGWDTVGENEVPNAVACPRCGSLFVPMLGCKEMTIAQSLNDGRKVQASMPSTGRLADFGELPPQMGPCIDPPNGSDNVTYVTYLSPVALRLSLERYVEEHGEEVLVRERLKELNPEIFYNFFWYCARFSLPLPLPIAVSNGQGPSSWCAFAAWDQSAAERGCFSAANALSSLDDSKGNSIDGLGALSGELSQVESFEDFPMLSRFNLQNFYSTVWDHPDLSPILVTLVEACEKRDFKPVIECVLRSNRRRTEEFGSAANDSASEINSSAGVPYAASETGAPPPSIELDVYRTLLYLAKYQCTTAFHAFFPATTKPCKGYHFWCAIGTPLPLFDRLVREGVQRINDGRENSFTPIHDVSDVALGFRCVFGHLI